MIPAVLIKNYIQEKLGLYAVATNDGAKDVLETKATAAIYINRTPYFADQETEAINIRVEFYVNCTTPRDQEQFDDKIGQLFKAVNGVKKTVVYNGKQYKFRVYFQSYEPLSAQYDSGKTMKLYQITGIVIATSSGAISAVDISVKLMHSSGIKFEPLILLKYSGDYTVNHELKVPMNGVEAVAIPDFISRVYSVYFIADNTAVSQRLENTAIGISGGLNENYSMNVESSNGVETVNLVKLLNVTLDCTIGGFATISATFRSGI